MCRNMVWGFGLISPGLGCGPVACENSKELRSHKRWGMSQLDEHY